MTFYQDNFRNMLGLEKASEMKVHKKGRNRYIKMQEGGLGVFHVMSKYKRGGGGMFGMLAKSARSILPWVEKKFSKL